MDVCRPARFALPILLIGFWVTPSLMLAIAGNERGGGDLSGQTGGSPPSKTSVIANLILQLGDPQYVVRQAAQEKLLRRGPEVFDALLAAETSDDVEISSRAKYLLQLIPVDRDTDPPQVKRILQGYSLADDAGRLVKIKQLSNLPQDAGIVPLCRLLRYERSQTLSKQAALHLLWQVKESSPQRDARLKMMEPALEGSMRPAAQWLQAEFQLAQNPQAALDKWDWLIDQEVATLAGTPGDTSREIILAIERRQAEALLKRDCRQHALDIMRKMIAIQKAETQPLAQLTDWLLKQDAPELVEEAAKHFESAFHANPVLLYLLAEANLLENKKAAADAIAAEAEKLIPQHEPGTRRKIAMVLRERGLFDWSEREFRKVIETAPNNPEAPKAQYIYADMLHDLERDKEAATVLQDAVANFTRNRLLTEQVQQGDGISPNQFKSMLHYYTACDLERQGKTDRVWTEMRQSLADDPGNVDALIGMYRVSAGNAERRAEVVQRIRKDAEQTMAAINSNPGGIGRASEEAVLCNQYAWLIGNTEGDIDQAIQLSHRSIEIVYQRNQADDDLIDLSDWGGNSDRNAAGYIDTLAHCYARKGDYENAVKYQSRAAELEPHSMAIVRAATEYKTMAEELRDGQQEAR